ncbi:MAG: putative transposase, partial [Mycobacteriales bacterium]
FDVLTYRKAPYPALAEDCFSEVAYTDEHGETRTYTVAETGEAFDIGKGRTLWLRQVMRRTDDGSQLAILTSSQAPAGECCHRLGGRWRQENYFGYAREHFALDALDSYAAVADDPARLVVNPAKTKAQKDVEAARMDLHVAQSGLAEAIGEAAVRAGRSGGSAQVPAATTQAVASAEATLAEAREANAAIASHLPLGAVRPDAQLLDTERKLITHAVRIAAYNAETTLLRLLAPHYARTEHEGRALLREAFTLPGDIEQRGNRLQVRLDPASAPRRTRAIAALCEQLTATETVYPGTDLVIDFSIKTHPTVP